MPLVDSAGSRAAYTKIERVLRHVSEVIPLSRITAVGPQDRTVTALRKTIRTPRLALGNVTVNNTTVGGTLVEHALIYRSTSE
jgi:hypothetical protein